MLRLLRKVAFGLRTQGPMYLLRAPAKEYPQFETALSLMPVLPPDEAVSLLRARALELSGTIWKMEAQLAELAQQDFAAMAGDAQLPAALAGQKFPPLFSVESEYHLDMVRAELDFVNDLVRRIVDDGWGPVDMWRSIQSGLARQHETPPSPKSVSKRSE